MARGASAGQRTARARAGGADGTVPVVIMGLGFVGQELVRAAARSMELEVLGAVDRAPSLVGRSLAELTGASVGSIKVHDTLAAAVGGRRGAVVLHATSSRLEHIEAELLDAIRCGLHVVSTCEELAFPWFRHPELADRLDLAAQKAGVSVLGTGINPGFVLDRLVATLGQACGPVRSVRATRTIDAATRSPALQRRVGAGLTEDEFFERVDRDQLGHVGLVESAALCALGLALDCDDYEEEIAPVLAEETLTHGAFPVPKGRVAGLSQTAVGLFDGQERVRLELTIALGVEQAVDTIVLDADPRVEMTIANGISGLVATANVVVNAAPRVAAAQPGLLTVLELPAGR